MSDPNAVAMEDCIHVVVHLDNDSIPSRREWAEEGETCLGNHNYHAKNAVCKKMLKDKYYDLYKQDTGVGDWSVGITRDDVAEIVDLNKLPELIEGKYIMRCVATECEDGYELARDKNGNSQGWCQKKKSAPAPVLADGGCMFTFDDGTVVGPAGIISEWEWKNIWIVYDDDYNTLEELSAANRTLKKIGDIDISSYVPEYAKVIWADCHGVSMGCNEADGWYRYYDDKIYDEDHYNENIHGVPDGSRTYTSTNPRILILNPCVRKGWHKKADAETGDDKKGTKPVAKFAKKAELDAILAEYFGDSNVSVWKDEKGGFNTARLASDSVAGVVLGTVGGVVTSNIIKKNQIKNGFEDLKCTINGQDVATYGDEFRVGVK